MLAISLSVLGSMPAAAQSSNNPLLSLLEGLEGLSTTGDMGGLFGSRGGSSLDSSRRSGFDDFGRSDRSGSVRLPTRSAKEITLLESFCSAQLSSRQQSLVKALTLLSPIEQEYCVRAGSLVEQYGYNIFKFQPNTPVLGRGSIGDDYILGIGDELVITFHGQVSRTSTERVNQEGRLFISPIGPVVVAGRSISEFRAELNAAVRRTLLGTEVVISLGQVRAISVLVAGEVERPGLHQATSLSSLLEVLIYAGGPKKTGSLRSIQLKRGNSTRTIDLYNIGKVSMSDLKIADGDRVFVPIIGRTVALVGDVKRPAIYELVGEEGVSSQDALNLAGGLVRPRGNQISLLAIDDLGREAVFDGDNVLLGDGDLLLVGRSGGGDTNSVRLAGQVKGAMRRSLAIAPTIGALLSEGTIGDNPYLPLAVLETSDPVTKSRQLFAVNAQRIVSGQEDFRLRAGDRLVLLGRDDVLYLSTPTVQRILLGHDPLGRSQNEDEEEIGASTSELITGESDAGGLKSLLSDPMAALSEPELVLAEGVVGCASLGALERLITDFTSARFNGALIEADQRKKTISSLEQATLNVDCREVYEDVPGLLPFVLENAVLLIGEVRQPGIYPIASSTTLTELVSNAGGTTRLADFSRIGVTRAGNDPNARRTFDVSAAELDAVSVGPGDIIRFHSQLQDREAGFIRLAGQFVRPGTYDIRRGDTLSSLVARAGGLTKQAYPFGAFFTRESIKKTEEENNQRLSRDLNAAILVASVNGDVSGGTLNAFRQLTRDVSKIPFTGRVVIEADPAVLAIRPERDIVLQPGDSLHMPKRPGSVFVSGEVLNPGALQFRPGMDAGAYISQAGGLRKNADRGKVFVVFANGEARPLSLSAFNFSSLQIPPGSAIVVPQDITRFNLLTASEALISLVSSLALTAASIAVINN